MNAYQLRFDQTLVEIPWWWLDGALVWLAVIGLVLWLLGRGVVRPMMAVGAMLIAGTIVLIVARGNGHGASALIWSGGAALAGLALGWLMYRPSMAVILAASVALGAPAALMMWQGTAGPDLWSPLVETVENVRQSIASVAGNGNGSSEATDTAASFDAAALPSLTEPLRQLPVALGEAWRTWWADLDGADRFLLISSAAGSAVVAFLIGIALPNLAASLVTALVGTLLMSGGLQRLITSLPDTVADFAPDTPRRLIIFILGATIIGTCVQWTIFRRRTDK